MNPDEEQNFQIALNHHQGNGYTLFDTDEQAFVPTSFHGSFPVFTYGFLLETGITKKSWILFVYVLSLILFGLSIHYFYKICLRFLHNQKFALWATITYCLYPSTLYYIGALFTYENMVLPILIIVFYRLLRSFDEGFGVSDYLLIPVMITLSCLFRPQTIAVYALLLLVYMVIAVRNRSFKWVPIMLITAVVAFASHVPILMKNKKMFGEYALSTQTGYEFLQGHNPTARGSWSSNWKDSSNVLYQYVHSEIENIHELNEWEEGKARKQLALDWMTKHPVDELKLTIRKLAIYFLPKNYDFLPGANAINPINLLIHLLFMAAVLLSVIKRSITPDKLFLFTPIAASIILSVVFFVGFRWRYYAEPFMIVFAWYFILALKNQFERRRAKSGM